MICQEFWWPKRCSFIISAQRNTFRDLLVLTESSCNPCSCNHGQAIIQMCLLCSCGWRCRNKRGLKAPVRINSGQSCCRTWTRTCWSRLIMKGWEITPQIPNVITSGPCHRARESWCHADACPALCATPLNMLTFAAQQDTGDTGDTGQFDPSGAKPPAVARCFNEARCAAVALQHLAQTLIQIQMLWSHRRGTKRIPMDHSVLELLKWWNQPAEGSRNPSTWWIARLD